MITRCPHIGYGFRERHHKAYVGKLRLAVHEHDVGRLHVAMNDPFLVGMLQP